MWQAADGARAGTACGQERVGGARARGTGRWAGTGRRGRRGRRAGAKWHGPARPARPAGRRKVARPRATKPAARWTPLPLSPHAVRDVTNGPSRTSRKEPGGRPARLTWRLLSIALLIVVLATGTDAFTGGATLNWIAFVAVGVALFAAVSHRNVIVALEAGGRAEAENFARILSGLARSVSADAIVDAIVDDLAEGTGADHVVVVRRRADGAALDATLVTRRAGVPNSRTMLPLGDLFADDPAEAPEPIAIPIAMEGTPADRAAMEGTTADRGALAGTTAGVARASLPTGGPSIGTGGAGPGLLAGAGPGPLAGAGPGSRAGVIAPTGPGSRAGVIAPTGRFRRDAARGGRIAGSRPAPAPTLAKRVTAAGAWAAQLLTDLGLPDLRPSRRSPLAARSEVLGSGSSAQVASRIAERVGMVYGLSHTLAAPLLTDDGVIGAIVLSRRAREPWPEPARRLLKAATDEAAGALARALTYREAEANASTDPLTGLPNRRYFDEFCGLLARRRRSGDAVAVLMVDIDRFKALNDAHGHPVGDEVLRLVAGAIVSAVREEDVPARVGGEEFAVLLRNPGPDVALDVGERVRAAVRALDLTALGVPAVSVSVGVANSNGPDEPIPAIVDRADRALYRAKRGGRDRVIAA